MAKRNVIALDLGEEDWRKLEWLMKHYVMDAQHTIEWCIEEAAKEIREEKAGRP
jgi:hypothetical protein